MGLFCQMLHVYDVGQPDVEKALGSVLSKRSFSLLNSSTVNATELELQVNASSMPTYIIGPNLGRWTPIIDVYAKPWTGDICTDLSRKCSTYVLCLMVYDDDVMFYNLDQNGNSLDGYNSNPQYFEKERVPESEIQSQRHTPEPFTSFLPSDKTLDSLLAALNAGWWQAHDSGRLDNNGVMTDEDWDACPYQGEGGRMTALGTLLQLAGHSEYPFANWRENTTINWEGYKLLQYGTKPSLLGRMFRKKT